MVAPHTFNGRSDKPSMYGISLLMGIRLSLDQIIAKTPKGSKLTPIGFAVERWKYQTGKPGIQICCKCECGYFIMLPVSDFLSKTRKSCGCMPKWNSRVVILPEHRVAARKISALHANIKARCYNKSHPQYKTYGGRGVRVCDEWLESYSMFYDWCVTRWKPGLELDKDIKGNGLLYSPENCIFVTPDQNRNHRRNTVKIVYKGKLETLYDACKYEGVSHRQIWTTFRYYIKVHNRVLSMEEIIIILTKNSKLKYV